MAKKIKDGALIDGAFSVKKSFGKKIKTYKMHNTMSEDAQNVLLGLSASLLFNGASPLPYGRLCFTTPGMRMQSSTGIGADNSTLYYDDDRNELGLRLFILNLTASELSSLTKNSKYIPIKDGNGDLSNKVVGYGSFKVNDGDLKAGTLINSDSTKMIEPYSCSNAWGWGANKANFEYNAFAIASLDPIDSFAAYKCINAVNVNEVENEITGNFVIPGFTGITGANEILLNHTSNGVSKWLYNLKTGETRQVESNEAAYNFDITDLGNQQVVINGKLFAIRVGLDGEIENYVDVYTPDGGRVKYISFSSKKYRLRGLFTDGTDLYASVTKYSTSGNPAAMIKINTDTYATETIENTAFSWGNLPSKFGIDTTAYIKASYEFDGTRYYVVGDTALDVQFICTDLSNVAGSIVATAPIFDCAFNIDGTEDGMYLVCYGTKTNKVITTDGYNERTLCSMLPINYILNAAGSSGLRNDYQTTGVWVNNYKFSNFLSFYKYDSTQSKTIAQQMDVTYSYEIGIRN